MVDIRGDVCPPAHLILLREAEGVIGLESLNMVRQVTNCNGWVFSHSWKNKRTKIEKKLHITQYIDRQIDKAETEETQRLADQ